MDIDQILQNIDFSKIDQTQLYRILLTGMEATPIEENLQITGEFNFKHIRKGHVILDKTIKNLITNAGKEAVANLLIVDVGDTAFDYIAIGTGTTAANATDTTLETEITTGGGERRGGANVTGTKASAYVAQLVTTFTFTSSFAVTECGVLNAASSGDLLCRQVFAAVNVVNTDSLQVTWQITVSTS